MKRTRVAFPLVLATLVVWLLFNPRPSIEAQTRDADHAIQAPDFPQKSADAWINSAPLRLDQLRGKVVLIDFWTFDCWNCYRSFPWLNDLATRYSDKNLQIIGVHTPEFAHEKNRSNVEKKVAQFGLTHPVMMDNDFRYWNAMNNRYWPAFYILDSGGKIRAVYAGEVHKGDRRALAIEATIQQLLSDDQGIDPKLTLP